MPVSVLEHPVVLIREYNQSGRDAQSEYTHSVSEAMSNGVEFRTYCCKAWNAPMPSVSGRR